MPPRAVKKAVAKKASPKAKGAPETPSKLSPEIPETIVEEKTDLEVEVSAAVKVEATEPFEEEAAPEGEEAGDDGEDQMDAEEGAEEVEKDAGEGIVADGAGSGPSTTVEAGDELGDGDDSASDDNEEGDPSIHMQPPLSERKKEKELEIFIGGLHKEAVEDDLKEVFGVFGDIDSIRIVRNAAQKSKGFAFIRFATAEHAKKALDELKDGTEIKGKQAKLSASQDNNTLYLGNICKTWTKDLVLETLKGLGVENIEHISLPDDPKHEGKTKGFAFLEFLSHADTVAAFHLLRKPDAVLGCDVSAKVAFTTSTHHSEEAVLQVKTVFVEGIPDSWDEEKIQELCKQYGEIEKIQLSRNLKKSKRNDFGFVEFTSRESAVACVEGISNAQLIEGETQVKANLAKPQNKGHPSKQRTRGGFKVEKDGEVTENAVQSKNNAKSKEVPDKEKGRSKLKNTAEKQPSKAQSKGIENKKSSSKAAQPAKGKKRGAKSADVISERPFKKARQNQSFGKIHGRPSQGSGNQRKPYSGRSKVDDRAYPNAYAPSGISYQAAYAVTPGSNYLPSDLQPHAGYISSSSRVQNPYGNGSRRYIPQGGTSRYAGAVPVIQPPYPVYPSYAGYEAGYPSQRGGAYGRPYY